MSLREPDRDKNYSARIARWLVILLGAALIILVAKGW